MYKINNDVMLKFFQTNNETKFFYTCCDIANAGKERYGIKSVEFYTQKENTPGFEYVEFIENLFKMLFVYINTTSDNLIESACKKATEIFDLYDTVQISMPNIDLMKNDIILKYFNISDINKSEHGIYALLSNNKLPKLNIPDNVEISIASSEQIEKIKSLDNFDNEEWDYLPRQLPYIQSHQSELLILLHNNNVLAGYLHANTLYKNFYDIANLFVHKDFRGNGFGILLTVYYAHYCLNNGFIPHYGSATSKYSENVAIKSGFEEMSRSHYFKITKK
ncbi:MAG: GNAT family N-acetyltransferase [Oscillospiraceae bacterium]|nr:GNAT family N-acetyltransferase [Oscillospiraceae bacterium]